jgi:phenylpropionate dioxygenase-like ring-hydroxylating dioxygenase large terminal subunit
MHRDNEGAKTEPEFEHQVTGRAYGTTNFPLYDALPLGFRNYWYPIAFASTLKRRPVRVMLCGDEVVLVRGQNDRPRALEDRCAHRGIPLSAGRVEFPGTISCAYHGWTYSTTTGDLVAVLTDGPDSPIAASKGPRVRTYPVEERAGLIWIYPGTGPPPPFESRVPDELVRADTLVRGRVSDQEGDWRHAAEAGFDEGHAKYLHRRSIWKFFRYLPAWTTLNIHRSDDGQWLTRNVTARQYSGNYPTVGLWPPKKPIWKRFEGTTSRAAALVGIRLPGILRVAFHGSVFGSYTGWEMWVPTEIGRYRYVQLVTRQGSVLGNHVFATWYWLYMRWAYHKKFNGQDTEMIRQMRTPPERLYRPDVSIVEWRRMCEEALSDEPG